MVHPLSSDPRTARVSPERMKELALVAKGGELSQAQRSEIAQGFIRLALKIAASYGTHKEDDFASAGLFGIVKALEMATEKVNLYQANEPDVCPGVHLGRWILSCIHKMINKFRTCDHLVLVPPRTIYKEKTKGNDLRFQWHDMPGHKVHRDPKTLEVNELLARASKDGHDEEIINLRSQGYNDREIADMMNVSKSYVHKKRSLIQERYNQLSGETW